MLKSQKGLFCHICYNHMPLSTALPPTLLTCRQAAHTPACSTAAHDRIQSPTDMQRPSASQSICLDCTTTASAAHLCLLEVSGLGPAR